MIIGIDLGTTNSLVAYFDGNKPQIIPNRLGKNLTPSIVAFGLEDEIYVGETAKAYQLLKPERAISIFKRHMGSQKKYAIDNHHFKPEEVASFLLRALKEDAETYLKEAVIEAVISVPAHFNNEMRRATKRAGELAGLKVERIISEPTAAAIAYGLYQEEQQHKFLVFDLGGGTFDVSLLERFHTILEVRAVAGDNYLGGEDFTEIITKQFIQEHNLRVDGLTTKEMNTIKDAAEAFKCQMSQEGSTHMVCEIRGEVLSYELTTEKYEKLSQALLERIRGPIQRVLSDAKIKTKDIDKIVLVGGATKHSLIYKFVSKLFKCFPDTSINPDEVVALGAAVQGAMKERHQAIKEVILTDVCPFTLGTNVVKEIEENHLRGGYFFPIIERNTVIPASRTERLYTAHDNQSKINVEILQGESRFTEYNVCIGELTVDVPKGKAGEEAIDITYTYDINAILEVEVKIISTGHVEKKIIKGQNAEMTDEEIQNRFEELAYLKIPPREQEENKLILFKAERLYEQSIGEVRRKLEYELLKFDAVLNTQDKQKIEKGRACLKEVLDEIEHDRI